MNYLFATSMLLLSLLQIGQWVSKTGVLSKITSRESSALLEGYECKHEYTIELMSFDPLVIYANNFVSNAEISHLLETTLVLPLQSPKRHKEGTANINH